MTRIKYVAIVAAVAVLAVASTTTARFETAHPTAFARRIVSSSHPDFSRRLLGFGGSDDDGSNSNSGASSGGDSASSSIGDSGGGSGGDSSASTSSSDSDAAASSRSSAAAAASQSSAAAAQQSSSQAAAATSSSSSAAAAKSSSQAAASVSASRASVSSSAASTPTVLTSTDSAGATTVVTSTVAYSSDAASSTATSNTSSDSNSSNHTPLIIGVSVVGGVAVLGAIIFLWMKFGGKRFSDYENDDADIKWPELKTDHDAALQPLPARRTGGAGFDMGGESDGGHEAGGDNHSMQEYGNKGRDSFTGSSTALNAYSNTSQLGGPGYYDPYGSSAYAVDPQQVQQHQAYDNGGYSHGDVYGQMQDPYMGAPAVQQHTSPSMDPYRVQGHQGQPMQNPYA